MRIDFSRSMVIVAALITVLQARDMEAGVGLTIYNQNFGVVRDRVPLDLRQGSNQVRFAEATSFLEPSSVVLRDPSNQHRFQVLEQNYRGDPVSPEILLALNEGKTIDFEITQTEGQTTRREIVSAKIVRGSPGLEPVVEMNGKLRFGLPGRPIFPVLGDNTILRPTLHWVIESETAAKFDAEVSYVTGEMRWEADYNLVLPESGNKLDIVGWVTIDNQCGKSFENAHVKLMAGDVSKIYSSMKTRGGGGGGMGGGGGRPPVSEKSFDEYHLYTLENPTTLLDRQKKQVAFVEAMGVNSKVLYVYDGSQLGEQEWYPQTVRSEADFGAASTTKIWVMREFKNSATNHLGLPMPKGRLRLYRRDTGGQMEFVGENVIDHTPRDEWVRLTTGNAFDLVGERKRTDLKMELDTVVSTIDPTTGLPVTPARPRLKHRPFIDESFEITLRNHKKEPVEVRVIEHLYRWTNWDITRKSRNFSKKDAQTIEFVVQIPPDEQQQVHYTVRYTW